MTECFSVTQQFAINLEDKGVKHKKMSEQELEKLWPIAQQALWLLWEESEGVRTELTKTERGFI